MKTFTSSLFIVILIVLSGFRNHDFVSSQNNTTQNDIELSTEKASSYCYIKKIREENGKIYIVTDFVVMKETQEGGGYAIVNNNPKLRTYLVSKDIKIFPTLISEEEKVAFLKSGGQTYTIEQVKKLLANDAEQLFYIKAKKGKIYHFIAETMAG